MKKIILAVLLAFAGQFTVSAQTIKVLSYNIHVGQDAANKDELKNMASFIKSSKADIVGLQEVDSVCKRTGGIDQMKYLAGQTGMYFAYARHFAFDGGAYGIGILSRYPLNNIRDHRVILTSDGKSDAATRAFLTADISLRGKTLTFATVHMDYRDSKSRVAQSKDIIKTLTEIKNPLILTGDFNARPGTEEVLNLEEVFTDTGSPMDISYPAIGPKNKIDYIMVSKNHLKRVSDHKVIPVTYSDHLPVFSKLILKIQANDLNK